MTQTAINAVFADSRLRKKFTHPRVDKAICEERMRGELWQVIARRHKKSCFYCREVTRRVMRLYVLFVE